MDIIPFDVLSSSLSSEQINSSSEQISNQQLEEIMQHINLQPEKEIGKGKCLFNAIEVAKVTNAKIVEGIASVDVSDGSEQGQTIIKHAWNKIGEYSFDITKDFVWPNMGITLNEVVYESTGEYTIDNYNIESGTIEFTSNANQTAISMKYYLTKNRLLESLTALGLEATYHEKILKEIIDSIN